jgi:hypothetical protein
MPLSLSPRYDLFRFSLPKDFLPTEVEEKYLSIIKENSNVLSTPIDYLNESIQGINFPGISDIIVQQTQHSSNSIQRRLGKINVEPKVDISYQTPGNPLDKIEHSFKITFRMNQGLYNYFMLYETIFHQVCKPLNKGHQQVFYIELLNEYGEVTAKIIFKDVLIDGIDGLEFNYNKIERDAGTFDVNFKFNNIDFEFVENKINNEHEDTV